MRFNLLDALNFLDSIESITLKDNEKKIIDVLRERTLITRSELEKITGIPERSLRRKLIKLESYDIIRSFRIAVKLVQLNPLFVYYFRFISHGDYDFLVMRRNISQHLLQSFGCSKKNQSLSLHSQNSFESERGEELGREEPQ